MHGCLFAAPLSENSGERPRSISGGAGRLEGFKINKVSVRMTVLTAVPTDYIRYRSRVAQLRAILSLLIFVKSDYSFSVDAAGCVSGIF